MIEKQKYSVKGKFPVLTAYVRVDVLPEKCIEFEQTVFSLQQEFFETTGCLNYNIYKDTIKRTTYLLISEWQNQEVLERHLQANNFAVLQGAINNLCEPPEVKFKIASLLDSQSPPTSNSSSRNTKGFLELIHQS